MIVHEATIEDPQPTRANGSGFKDPAFGDNRNQPVHRWVPWIAGFSAGFVSDCIDDYLPAGARPEDVTVMDPFAGVGTTLVEAVRKGCNTVGFEVNPYAALSARAKLGAPEVPLPLFEFWIRAFRAAMRDAAETDRSAPIRAPEAFRSRIPFFSPQVERQALLALSFIRGLADQRIRDLFVLAFGSVMVGFSNYSYEPSLASRPGAGKPLIERADVALAVCEKLREFAEDCEGLQTQLGCRASGRSARVIQDTVFNAAEYLPAGSVDLAITSPPYLNNYHYVRNTRPHLYWLDLVSSTADLRQIELASFGTFWQTVRDGAPIDLAFDLPPLANTLDRLRGLNREKGIYGGAGWANYAAQYFNDTDRLCQVMAKLLKPGGRFVVVIGNSILQGVEIAVDDYLAQIAARHGLCREARHMLRTKRVGNSIIRSSVRNAADGGARLYEVAVVLRKD